jgi:hypothetical protein
VQLVRLLLLLHLGATAALLLLLALVVLGQSARTAAAARRLRTAGGATALDQARSPDVPTSGASVLDWTVDLRGVGQREAALRT